MISPAGSRDSRTVVFLRSQAGFGTHTSYDFPNYPMIAGVEPPTAVGEFCDCWGEVGLGVFLSEYGEITIVLETKADLSWDKCSFWRLKHTNQKLAWVNDKH